MRFVKEFVRALVIRFVRVFKREKKNIQKKRGYERGLVFSKFYVLCSKSL